MKKFIKYISRIVLGSLTIFSGLLTCISLIPDDYPCGSLQAFGIILFGVSTLMFLILFCIGWHVTKKW